MQGWNPRWHEPVVGDNHAALRRLAASQRGAVFYEMRGTRHASPSDVPAVLRAWSAPFAELARLVSPRAGRAGDARDADPTMDPEACLDAMAEILDAGFLEPAGRDAMRAVVDAVNAAACGSPVSPIPTAAT